MPSSINCPKCGAPNFAHDHSCGVCGGEFGPLEAEPCRKPRPIPWTGLLIAGLVIFLIGVVLDLTLFHSKYDQSEKYIINRNHPSLDTSRVKYAIDGVENNPPYCIINVRLQNKISTVRLESLSARIWAERDCDGNKVRILYRLPETELGKGVWARVDYDSSFSLQFLSMSLEQEEYAKAHKGNFHIIGAWEDNTSGALGMAVRIRKNAQGQLIMEYYPIVNPDAEDPMATELKEVERNGKTVFKNIEPGNRGEFYSIEPNGNLACYDKTGFLLAFKKL